MICNLERHATPRIQLVDSSWPCLLWIKAHHLIDLDANSVLVQATPTSDWSYAQAFIVGNMQVRKIDNGYLVAWENHLNYKITKASSSILGSILSGEGLVCSFTGLSRKAMGHCSLPRYTNLDACVNEPNSVCMFRPWNCLCSDTIN